MQSNYGDNRMLIEHSQLFLHTQFELTAHKHPDEVALVFANEKITFKELNSKADNLCHGILNWAYYEDFIGISSTPSIDMVIGILAILKAGKAFVPIDPNASSNRNQQIIQDCAMSFCIAKENEYEAFYSTGLNLIYTDNERLYPVITDKRMGKLAYLMYTSGSTCQPKGVKIEHKSILHYLNNAMQNFSEVHSFNTGSFLHMPITFDGALTALFVTLLSGKKLVLAKSNQEDAFLEANFKKFMPYDFLKLTPIQLNWLELSLYDCVIPVCDRLVIGGEALHHRHLNFLKNKGLDLTVINEYGPTEATVGCMNYSFHIDDTDVPESPHGIPVGEATKGMEVCVLDKNLQPVKNNEVGEIYISGPQVSNGYMMRPELNDELFVVISSNNALKTYFKTGDQAFYDESATMFYIDRAEYKIQVDGNEVDLDLVEYELSKIKGVLQCKVICKIINDEYKILSYIIPDTTDFDLNAIQSFLRSKLPEAFIPKKFIIVNDWPYTPSGKLNRHALPLPGCPNKHESFRMPESEIELQIANIWKQILGHDPIDVQTSFFEVGGNHLKAEQFVKQLNKQYGHEIELSEFYKCSSISCMTKSIERTQLKNKQKGKPNQFKSNKNTINKKDLLD